MPRPNASVSPRGRYCASASPTKRIRTGSGRCATAPMSNTEPKIASDNASASPVIVITSGEPAGIGPDICLCLAQRAWPARLVVLGDRGLLAERAAALGLDAGRIEIRHVPLQKSALAGRLDPANAAYVLALLDVALAGCRCGEYAAMVTA